VVFRRSGSAPAPSGTPGPLKVPRTQRTSRPLTAPVLPDLPRIGTDRARVIAVVDQGARGVRGFAWACGYVARTPGAVLITVVVDAGVWRHLAVADVNGPLEGALDFGLNDQVALLRSEAAYRGVEAYVMSSEHPVGLVLDAVLGRAPDLIVAGFGAARATRPHRGPLGRVIRDGIPLVTVP